jgi:hypothetical protein
MLRCLFLCLALTPLLHAQETAAIPAALGENLFSLQGTHVDSATEYLRLFTTAVPPTASSQAKPAPAPDLKVSPTFTLECTQRKSKRTVHLYVNFGNVEDLGFPIPFQPTPAEPFPPQNPSFSITLVFEGYMQSRPFKRSWEQLPNGNYRYRNPGIGSPNLDDPRFFLQYLHSLPTLHVTLAKPGTGKPAEAYFRTAALLQQAANSPLCQP